MIVTNIISLSRIPILFMVVVFLHIPISWLSVLNVLLFIFGSLTDWLDGFLARKFKLISDFGKILDTLTDKVYTIGLYIALLTLGLLPEWALITVLIILTREFVVTGLRLLAINDNIILAAENIGKLKTSLKMTSIGIFLFYKALIINNLFILSNFMISTIYGIGLTCFLFSVLLTLVSGVNYILLYGYLLKNK